VFAAAVLTVLGLLATLLPRAHSSSTASVLPAAPGPASPEVCLGWYGFAVVSHTCPCSMSLGGDGVTVSTFFSGVPSPNCQGCSAALDLKVTCPTYSANTTMLYNGACYTGTNRVKQYCPTAPTMQIAVAEVFCWKCNEPLPQ
jgi:hypothetical protein